MSLLFKRGAVFPMGTPSQMIAERTQQRGYTGPVSREQALRHSAVWAALRLRADLISTMPVDVYRRVQGIQVEAPKTPVIIAPGGPSCRWMEWIYSSQIDLDSLGNAVGIVLARDSNKQPSLVELAKGTDVTFMGTGQQIQKVKIGSTEYDYATEIWHEKQYTIAGVPVGLSPISYAATSLKVWRAASAFAVGWYGNGTIPSGHLQNTAKVLNKKEAQVAKEAFMASIGAGEVWVSGKDWSYSLLNTTAVDAQFLDSMEATVTDVCRFLSVPADLIDAASKGSSVTYANISQRNMQLLVMNLGPAILRREEAISNGLLPQPRYLKFNTDSLLRMDVASRYAAYGVAIDKKFMAPSEVRELENRPPFTSEQLEEFTAFSKAPVAVSPTVTKEAP